MNKPILVIGGASWDTIVHLPTLPDPEPQTLWPTTSYRALGSTGAGKSLNLAALGHPVVFHTLLGDDIEGRQVRAALQQPRLHTVVTETREATEQHVNLMAADGTRLSLFVQPPADPEHMDWAPLQAEADNCQLAVVNILGYARAALPWLRDLGMPIWTDLHDYDGSNPHHQPFIDAASVIFLSSDNLPDYRQTMTQLMTPGKTLVVCTHGAKGASLLTADGTWLEQPVIPAQRVRDTNGAGDAFFSGFLHRYLAGDRLPDCLRAGAVCGALCVASRSLVGHDLSAERLG